MAFNKSPAHWFGDGYAADSEAHSITFLTGNAPSNKSLPQLTDESADPATGDVRALAFAILEKLYLAWLAQGLPVNLSKKMKVARSVSSAVNGNLRYNYTFQFELSPSGEYTVVSE